MKPHHWLLIIAIAVIAWFVLRDDEPRRRALNYDQLAVSEGLTAEAEALDLSDDLDVSLLPDIGRQVIRDATRQGLREQAFLQYVLREVSNRVREISTIDLNGDGVTDPVLVKPEPQEGEQFVLLSIRVPAPDAYPLPEARDTDAWKDVDSVEVATMTVALDPQALTVQAQGNSHLYPNAPQQHYVVQDTVPSFLSMYFAMRMLDWMFFPPMWGFWGPGWGYAYHVPQPVPDTRAARTEALSRGDYQRASPRSTSAIRARGGAAPTSQYSRLYANQRPRALSQLGSSTAFSRRAGGPVAAGGFGRPGAIDRSPGAFSNRLGAEGRGALTVPRGAPRTFAAPSPFRRSFGRPGFGGFGRGGFRFGRCHGCWREPLGHLETVPGLIAWLAPTAPPIHS
jgi:hypothetical protein